MPRIAPATIETAPDNAKPLMEAVQKKFGGIPNILATMGHSAAVLGSYLQLGEQLSHSSLSPALREQLALAIAGKNQCGYCASAHTAIGAGLKLEADEMTQNLSGQATDAKTQAAIDFVVKLVEQRGHVSDADVQAVKDAGYSDAQVLEMVVVVTMNIFTNYFNHVVDTEIDFPNVELPG